MFAITFAAAINSPGNRIADTFATNLSFVLALHLAFALHVFLFLPIIYLLFTRRRPSPRLLPRLRQFWPGMATAIGCVNIAFGGSTLRENADNAGVDRSVSEFVFPLGALVQQNGTIIYLIVGALFGMLANGREIDRLSDVATVVITSLVLSVNPTNPGPFGIAIVFQAIGMPPTASGVVALTHFWHQYPAAALNVLSDVVCTLLIDEERVKMTYEQGVAASEHAPSVLL